MGKLAQKRRIERRRHERGGVPKKVYDKLRYQGMSHDQVIRYHSKGL